MACFSHFETAPALSVNERIAEFLDFAIQAKFAYVNKLNRLFCRQPIFYVDMRITSRVLPAIIQGRPQSGPCRFIPVVVKRQL